MAKLGYTWYPKDWGNSETVFELSLSERGLYRELIDMAMLSDNKTITNYKVWQRKFDIEWEELESILNKLHELSLIEFRLQEDNEDLPNIIFLPSCEPRLNLIRGGRNGGKKSKKNKPTVKPNNKPLDKPTINQIEKEIESKDKNIYHTQETFIEWFNDCRKFLKLPSNIKKLSTMEAQMFKELEYTYTKEEFKTAFKNFSKDPYYKNNNLLFPKNFLKLETFTKYLNVKELTTGEKLAGKC